MEVERENKVDRVDSLINSFGPMSNMSKREDVIKALSDLKEKEKGTVSYPFYIDLSDKRKKLVIVPKESPDSMSANRDFLSAKDREKVRDFIEGRTEDRILIFSTPVDLYVLNPLCTEDASEQGEEEEKEDDVIVVD